MNQHGSTFLLSPFSVSPSGFIFTPSPSRTANSCSTAICGRGNHPVNRNRPRSQTRVSRIRSSVSFSFLSLTSSNPAFRTALNAACCAVSNGATCVIIPVYCPSNSPDLCFPRSTFVSPSSQVSRIKSCANFTGAFELFRLLLSTPGIRPSCAAFSRCFAALVTCVTRCSPCVVFLFGVLFP